MKIPSEKIASYEITDEDVAVFLRTFDEPVGGKVLEVGSHDEPVANILTDCGYQVIGVDLREYNPNQDLPTKGPGPACNYTYIRHDFCRLPDAFLKEQLGTFDVAISLSALEHFGLGTYNEGGIIQPYYDVVAVQTIWQLLKEGGVFYVTVPFGKQHIDAIPHWRVYCLSSLSARMVQDFKVESLIPFVCGEMELDGKQFKEGNPISWEQACSFSGHPPHVSVLLKLRKAPTQRLAPNGR